jgi:hypothetical protein
MTAESEPEPCSSLDQDSDESSHREEDRQSVQDATNDTDIPSQEILVSDASIDMLTANGFDDDMKKSEGSCIVRGSSKEHWVNTGSPGQRSIRHSPGKVSSPGRSAAAVFFVRDGGLTSCGTIFSTTVYQLEQPILELIPGR